MNDSHFNRYVFEKIEEACQDTPVIFIMGARQSGKSTLIKSLAQQDWFFINLDDQGQLAIAKADPVGFIRNLPKTPIVIDEIQRVPELLLAIKQAVDEDRRPGRFLLTGSANALLLPRVADSLAGRMETILLNPLSECEIKNRQPSFLSMILDAKAPIAKETRIRNCLIERMVTGCFPEAVKRNTEKRIQIWYKQYAQSLIQKDIKEIGGLDHIEKMQKLLKLTAYYSGKLVNFLELGNIISLNNETTKKYIQLLEQIFLVKQLPAWHSNEYKRLIKTPKLHMNDTGLVCALRGMNQSTLLQHPENIGILLETFVINELQKQAGWFDEELTFYHYRDKDKIEVDCIIENSQGDCFAIEIKAAATLTSKDFLGLQRFKSVAGERFKFGVLLYDGDITTAFGENLFAVPLGALWS